MLKRKGLIFIFLLYTSWLAAQNTIVRTYEEDLYRSGMELLEHEKYGAAREFFQRYVELGRNDLRTIDAEYYIAFCSMNLFNADAENLFQNFIAAHPEHSKASQAYYDLGSFNFFNKKYEKAIEYFEKTDPARLSENQRNERNFKLGYSYFFQKDFEKALPYFNQVKTTENKHTYAARYYAGYVEFKTGQYDEALVDLKKAEENDAYKPHVPAMLVNIYYWQGKMDELIAYSEKLLAQKDRTIQSKDEILFLTGDAYYMKGDYKKASEYLKQYANEYKSKLTPEIKYRLAFSLYKTREVEAAIPYFKEIAGKGDSLQQASAFYLGHSYLSSGKKDLAIAAYDIAGKVNFNREIQEEALFTLGKINVDLQRFHDAVTVFRTFNKEFPKSSHSMEANELLNESLERTNNYAEVLAHIESLKIRSLKINQSYQRVTFYSGVQAFNNGNYQEAIHMFDKSLEFPIDKNYVLAASFFKGETHSVLKDYNSAINSYATVFQKGDESNEYHLKSRYGIGYGYFNTKQYDKALPHFKRYVERLRNAKDKLYYDDALLRLADLYFQNKNYNEAIGHYNEAITGKIKEMDYAYFQRGVVYGIMDKYAEAEKSLDVVIKNYPESVYHDDAIYEKADQNFNAEEYEKAIGGYTKLIQEKSASPYVPYAYIRRAGVYSNLKNYDKAIADYEKILTDYSSHPVAEDAFLGLQTSYNNAGRPEEFQKWIAVMEQRNPQNTLLVTARFQDAKNLYFAGKYPKAIESFNNYLNNYPNDNNVPEARMYLGNSYLETKDTINALKQYDILISSQEPQFYVESVQRKAEIQFAQQKYKEAIPSYLILLGSPRDKTDKARALMGLTESYYNLGNYDSTIVYALEIRKLATPEVEGEGKAMLYLGKSYYQKQEYEKATDYFLNTLNYAKDRNGAEAQFLIAEIQYKQKKYRQSLETLYQFNNNFSQYEDWLGKSYLLVADNFIGLNDTFQAKSVLNTIIENAKDPEVLRQANEKLKQLEGKEATNE